MSSNENSFHVNNIWQVLNHCLCILMTLSHAICLHKHCIYIRRFTEVIKFIVYIKNCFVKTVYMLFIHNLRYFCWLNIDCGIDCGDLIATCSYNLLIIEQSKYRHI